MSNDIRNAVRQILFTGHVSKPYAIDNDYDGVVVVEELDKVIQKSEREQKEVVNIPCPFRGDPDGDRVCAMGISREGAMLEEYVDSAKRIKKLMADRKVVVVKYMADDFYQLTQCWEATGGWPHQTGKPTRYHAIMGDRHGNKDGHIEEELNSLQQSKVPYKCSKK